MSERATSFSYKPFKKERESVRILIWNGGQPLLIDGRTAQQRTFEVNPELTQGDLLEWAAQNEVRCVGFGRDTRRARRSLQSKEATWAVV